MTTHYSSQYAGRKRAYTSGEFKPAWRVFEEEKGEALQGEGETLRDKIQAVFTGESDISLTGILTIIVAFMGLTAGGILWLSSL